MTEGTMEVNTLWSSFTSFGHTEGWALSRDEYSEHGVKLTAVISTHLSGCMLWAKMMKPQRQV